MPQVSSLQDIANFINAAYTPLFGTGADGALTISSGTVTLTRDTHYTNLTINGTGSIQTKGFRLFVSGVLDITAAPAGAITASGYAGGSGVGAAGSGGNAGRGGNYQILNVNSLTPSFTAGAFNTAVLTAPSGVVGGTPAVVQGTL